MVISISNFRPCRKLIQATVFLLLSFATLLSEAATIYIDLSLASNCTTYSPSSRSCTGGASAGYSSLSSGLDATGAGDTVLMRSGNYGQLSPPNSGLSGQPITIKNYPGETASISNLSGSVALWIINRTDLVIEGLQINNTQGFGRLQDSSRIVIQNVSFSNASGSGTTSSLKLVRTTYSKILDNTFVNGGDDVLLLQDDSDYNLVQGNSFANASHSMISVRCSSFNVFRKNTISNPNQKNIEIYDCEGISDAPVRLDDTKRNLFEENIISDTLASGQNYRYNAIQHGAQYTIVRRNVFSNNLGGGVNYQSYADESLYVYGNRMYNNTFYNNQCFGIIGNSGTASRYYDNRVTNNLLYKNTNCSGSGGQTSISNANVVILANNSLVSTDPGFVNEVSGNFSLTAGSQQIDAGSFITKTVGSGNGVTIAVVDASNFYDGYGIEGEIGDLVQIQGQSITARIVSINYIANTLTLDKSLTWTDGQGIHLEYSGTGPDVGAFEYGLTARTYPSAPTNLTISP